jgi:hypothetical protein
MAPSLPERDHSASRFRYEFFTIPAHSSMVLRRPGEFFSVAVYSRSGRNCVPSAGGIHVKPAEFI